MPDVTSLETDVFVYSLISSLVAMAIMGCMITPSSPRKFERFGKVPHTLGDFIFDVVFFPLFTVAAVINIVFAAHTRKSVAAFWNIRLPWHPGKPKLKKKTDYFAFCSCGYQSNNFEKWEDAMRYAEKATAMHSSGSEFCNKMVRVKEISKIN